MDDLQPFAHERGEANAFAAYPNQRRSNRAGSRWKARPLPLLLVTFLAAVLLGGAASAQDLALVYSVNSSQFDPNTGAAIGDVEEIGGLMTIHGDQMRVEDDTGNVMLIRLSGPYAGFMFLESGGSGTATFIEMDLARTVDGELTAADALSSFLVVSPLLVETWPIGRSIPYSCLEPVEGPICDMSVDVYRDGVMETVIIDAYELEIRQTIGSGFLPGMTPDDEISELGGMMDQFPIRVMSQSDVLTRYSNEVPGFEILSDFYLALSEQMKAGWVRSMVQALTYSMSLDASEGFPVVTITFHQTKLVVSDELAMIRPMLEMVGPAPSVSLSVLRAVDVDPLVDPDSLFYGGGVPPGYTLERPSEDLFR